MEYDPDFDQKSSGVVFISRDKKKSVRFISNEKVLIGELHKQNPRLPVLYVPSPLFFKSGK